MKRRLMPVVATALATVLLAAPVAQAKEVNLKGISAWPTNFPLTGDFLRFIELANKRGKGMFKITHIGGPEIAKAPAQSKGFKTGLYDLMFAAASYHRGVIPEVDALSATQVRPWDARKSGAMAALDAAITKRVDGILLAQTVTSVSFVLFLNREPKMTSDGMVSLEGFKMRSVPLYNAFLKELGATTVTVQVPELYNALERGLVDGFAFPELWTRSFGWAKFVKYRIYPNFYQLEPSIFMSNKALKKLTPEGQKLIRELGAEWEKISYDYWKPLVEKERETLNTEFGQKMITLTGAAAKKYLDLANTTPIKRLKEVGTPEAATLSKLYHGQ
jgi:TRAP-type C4-dicarboxylate transport system substrate-binding protein